MGRIRLTLGGIGAVFCVFAGILFGAALLAGCGGQTDPEGHPADGAGNAAADWKMYRGKLLGQLYADVCGQDGTKDLIRVWTSDCGESGEDGTEGAQEPVVSNVNLTEYMRRGEYVTVEVCDGSSDAAVPVFEYTVGTAHSGWANIGLVREDGKEYLVSYCHYMMQGEGSFGYEVFSLDESGEAVVRRDNWYTYTLPGAGEIEVSELTNVSEQYEKYVSQEKLEQIALELDDILKEVMPLASGNAEPARCYAFSLDRGESWDFLPRNLETVSDGRKVFLQGLGVDWRETDLKEIADWCREWKLEWAWGLPTDMELLRGAAIYASVTVGGGTEGTEPGDCRAMIADLIPGECVQLLVQDRQGAHRCKVWESDMAYSGVPMEGTYENAAEDFHMSAFEGLFGDEKGFTLHLTMYFYSDISYFTFKNGQLQEIACSWGSGPEQNYIVDVDGDGRRELVCEVVYYADGGRLTLVYWEEDGVIYRGFADDLLDVEYDNWGTGSCYSEYLPEENKVRIYYWIDRLEGYGHRDYAIELDKLYKSRWEGY